MSIDDDDPRCPECGGKIGQTATYCMHCSADLTDDLEAADANDDGRWDSTAARADESGAAGNRSQEARAVRSHRRDAATDADGPLLDPDGIVDNSLTIAVGFVGGIVVGTVGTLVLAMLTGGGFAVVVGLIVWAGATAHLVRQRTVQAAVSKTGYAVALALLLVPLVAISPVMDVDGGIGERVGFFFVLLFFVAVPAGVAAAIGWAAGQYVTPDDGESADR